MSESGRRGSENRVQRGLAREVRERDWKEGRKEVRKKGN